MIKWLLLAVLAVPLEQPCDVSECIKYNQTLVYAETGGLLQVGWGAYQNELDAHLMVWEAEFLEFPPKTGAVAVATIVVTEPAERVFAWQPSRPGLYYARIKACFESLAGDCSRWSLTYDPVDAHPIEFPRGFIILVTLAAPSGGGID